MKYTLKDAEKLDGVPSERTLKRHLRNGTISGEKNKKGAWIVLAAELHRAYNIKVAPKGQGDANGMTEKQDMASSVTGHGTTKKQQKNNDLHNEVKVLAELAESYKGQVEDLKNERDEWKEIAKSKDERLQLFLPAPQQEIKNNELSWGRGLVAASIIAILVIGVTIAVLSPEKLAFLKTNESRAVAAIPKTTPMINIEPAAGAPQDTAQPLSPALKENVR